MPTPVLVVLAGPKGAGKTTLFERVLAPVMHLEFVNADRLAVDRRQQLLSQGRSFITETVFSHPSKLELMTTAKDRGYRVHLHVVLIPEELLVARVASRVEHGGQPRRCDHRVRPPEHRTRISPSAHTRRPPSPRSVIKAAARGGGLHD